MATANKQPDTGSPLTLKIVRKFDIAPDTVIPIPGACQLNE